MDLSSSSKHFLLDPGLSSYQSSTPSLQIVQINKHLKICLTCFIMTIRAFALLAISALRLFTPFMKSLF